MVMLVADTNALRDPGLEQYLRAASTHRVVLADWTLTEMRKKGALGTSRDSLKQVFRYPRQFLVLRRTDKLLEDAVGDPASAEALVDPVETLELRQLASGLWQVPSPSWLVDHMAALEKEAVELVSRLGAEVETWYDEMTQAVSVFGRTEIRQLRSPKPGVIPDATMRKVLDLLLHTTRDFMVRNQGRGGTKPIKASAAMRMYGFRYSLCVLLFTLGWVRTGSQGSPDIHKRVNDAIDLQLATVGTFFNGILSRDKRLHEVSRASRHLLRLWGAYVGEDWPPEI